MRKKYLAKLAEYKAYVENGWPLAKVDFSDKAAQECFNWETHGGTCSDSNGYAIGKRWLDWQATFNREQLNIGLMTLDEVRQAEAAA